MTSPLIAARFFWDTPFRRGFLAIGGAGVGITYAQLLADDLLCSHTERLEVSICDPGLVGHAALLRA
ncbi:MAG: hypothetical protein ABI222_00900 [Opitutaceae bacterium]